MILYFSFGMNKRMNFQFQLSLHLKFGNMTRANQFLFLLISIFLFAFCTNQSSQTTNTSTKSAYIYNHGLIYGTTYSITYESPAGEDLQNEIEVEMNKLNSSLSTFDENSTISKINQNRDTELDDLFMTVYNKAVEVSDVTDGAFDITVAPMVNVWGFGFENKENVSQELIDSLKLLVGYKKIKIEGGKLIKEHPNTMLDCSAIAKGFACDLVADYLKSIGSENYMVEIGGEVVALGKNEKGNFWSIGISRPDDGNLLNTQELKAVIQLKEKAVATSGNYRNYYIENGKKYAHTIDPKTGYPVQHSLLSATVLADNCMTADAFATAFMVYGLDKSIELAESRDDIEVYFIYADENGDYKSFFSDGFNEILLREND